MPKKSLRMLFVDATVGQLLSEDVTQGMVMQT
jgi:hypothetical protein